MTVHVENISKRFGSANGAAAARSVSFEARPGAITTLLGPSGSGKSTLIRTATRLEAIQKGRVLIDNSGTLFSAHVRFDQLPFDSGR